MQVEDWLRKAQEDKETADFNKEHNKTSYAAFLYQQAIEKALKYILLAQGKQLIKTHDCFVLATKIEAPQSIQEAADKATPYYFHTRYPDESENITTEEVEGLQKASEEVIRWTKQHSKK